MINENKIHNNSNCSRDNSVIINNESNGINEEDSTLLTMIYSKQKCKDLQFSVSTVK